MNIPHVKSLKTWGKLLLSFGVAIAVSIYIAQHEASIKDRITFLDPAVLLFIILLYALLGFSPVPADPLMMINGAIFCHL